VNPPRKAWLVAVALAAQACTASACGFCVEDRIAAVYDHTLVQQASGGKLQLAYFSWDGPVHRDEAMRARIATAAQGVKGAAPGSVRVSVEPAAIAVLFDPATLRREQFDAAIDRKLSSLKVLVTPLQTPAVAWRPPPGATAAR